MDSKPGKRWAARGKPWAFLVLTAAVVSGLVVWWLRQPRDAGFGYDLQAVYRSSPFRNVHPEVPYVGDAACAECHGEIARSYRGHPMGRSLARTGQREPIEKVDHAGRNSFERLGLEFAVLQEKDGLIHRAARRGLGDEQATLDTPVEYVVGSGERGRSYLVARDGHLFQSPISWFSQKRAWDLSPGFEAFYPPERVIEPTCLFCHANQVEPVEHARNRYREPIFRGESIGCERCHGPGELHVKARRANLAVVGNFDDSIVNPRHLSPVLQEAVCQQCHLQGERRIERAGRKTFDYRPGLPLHEFWAIFVRDPELSPTRKAVGQVEQMHVSKCFTASKGKLGCTSCHDPHGVPSAGERVTFYRNRCLTCHAADGFGASKDDAGRVAGCALPRQARLKQQAEDSCIACHMPRFASSDIAHTAVTDHRVPRTAAMEKGRTPPRPGPDRIPITSFFANECPLGDPRADRDFGLALAYLADQPPLRQAMSARALPLLEQATKFAPADVAAWEIKGWVLSLQGRHAEAFEAYQQALRLAPERELALSLAGSLAAARGNHDDALDYLQRLVKVNPWMWEYRYQLAKVLGQKRDWGAAHVHAEAALDLGPTHKETRMLFVSACLNADQKGRAKQEFEMLLRLHPRDEKTLRTWFAEQVSASDR